MGWIGVGSWTVCVIVTDDIGMTVDSLRGGFAGISAGNSTGSEGIWPGSSAMNADGCSA